MALAISHCSLRHINILQLRITLHRRHAEVAADPALLEAAERRLGMHAGMRVDAQHAALDPARHAQGAAQVVRPERPAQAVGRRIHVADHSRLVVERRDAYDRAENFFAPAAVVFAHLKQDGGFEVVAPGARTIAAAGESAAALAGVIEELLNRGKLGGGDQGTEFGLGLHRVAHDELPRRGDELLDEWLVNAALDEYAAAGATILPAVGEHAHRRSLGGAL